MKIFTTIESYRQWRHSLPADATVGFVPTMGALHLGHARLLEESTKNHSHTVLSIFVNPTQFGPNEDLAKYPRTLEADQALAAQRGVSAIFLPSVQELYPTEFSTYVVEEKISAPLCGVFRPGHFRGVATVVLKLFNIVAPDAAYFGLKDAQQFLLIERMTRDLNLPVRVVGVPTVREESGLAMSSRNVYLSDLDRSSRAPILYRELHTCQNKILKGIAPARALKESRNTLENANFDVQYFELRDLKTLRDLSSSEPLSPISAPEYLLAAAVFLPSRDGGRVRLIDNIIF